MKGNRRNALGLVHHIQNCIVGTIRFRWWWQEDGTDLQPTRQQWNTSRGYNLAHSLSLCRRCKYSGWRVIDLLIGSVNIIWLHQLSNLTQQGTQQGTELWLVFILTRREWWKCIVTIKQVLESLHWDRWLLLWSLFLVLCSCREFSEVRWVGTSVLADSYEQNA
jgi:hypothetical protein